MPAPYDYTVAQPNVGTYFDAMRQGRADRLAVEQENRTSALSRYLPGALQGNEAQRNTALSFATPDQMIQLKQTFSQMDAQKLAVMRQNQGMLGAMAVNAKDPTAWGAVNAKARELGLPEVPFEQREMVIAQAQTVAEALKAAHDEKLLANDTSRTTAQNALTYAQMQAVKADASRRATAQPGVDPNTGVRTPPAGVQGKDVSQLQKYEQTADAFAGIATTLRGAQGAFDRVRTGPGTGIARVAASPFALFGVESANQFVGDYDAIDAASKEAGIEKLKGIGGSDTERELLTAIQTGVNAETPGPENKRRIGNAIAAAEIASQRHRLATEWVNKFGSLSYAANNGMTWPQFWSTYQKQAWADHLKSQGAPAGGDYRAEQRQLMDTPRGSTAPAPPSGFKVIP